MLRRIGLFLAVLAVATLALFVMSDMAEEPNGWLLFYGVILLGLAFGVLRSTGGSAAGSERFRLMRRLFGRSSKPSAPPPAASAPPPAAKKRGLFRRK